MTSPTRAALIEALYVSLVQTTLPNSLAHNPEVIAEAAKWGGTPDHLVPELVWAPPQRGQRGPMEACVTLPPETQRLLSERYSPEAMREWRISVTAERAAHSMFAVLNSMARNMKPAALAFARMFPIHRPRPVYPPLSPLTLRLLDELYGGTE